MSQELLQQLPSVDRLLNTARLQGLQERLSHGLVVGATREVLEEVRRELLAGGTAEVDPEALAERVAARVEAELAPSLGRAINATGIGPMAVGGRVTALAVKVNTAPCHIASLPVAVNVQCHAARHAEYVWE